MIKSCKYCANRITDNSGVSYCKMQKSTRTYNGLKLVKASSMACVMYKRKQNDECFRFIQEITTFG